MEAGFEICVMNVVPGVHTSPQILRNWEITNPLSLCTVSAVLSAAVVVNFKNFFGVILVGN